MFICVPLMEQVIKLADLCGSILTTKSPLSLATYSLESITPAAQFPSYRLSLLVVPKDQVCGTFFQT